MKERCFARMVHPFRDGAHHALSRLCRPLARSWRAVGVVVKAFERQTAQVIRTSGFDMEELPPDISLVGDAQRTGCGVAGWVAL